MIELVGNLDIKPLHKLLETRLLKHLKPDVSSYARGRMRIWLRTEPMLTKELRTLPGYPTTDETWNGLQKLINWPFDYCLVTFSTEKAIGITPHRDASYADYEAMSLTVSGSGRFFYWMDRPSFGHSQSKKNSNPNLDKPTHILNVSPGDLVRFNCKNLHAMEPSINRWNLNFWRKKS